MFIWQGWSLLPKHSDLRAYNKHSKSSSSSFFSFLFQGSFCIQEFYYQPVSSLMLFRISSYCPFKYGVFSVLIVGSCGGGSVLLYVSLLELRAGLLKSRSGRRGNHLRSTTIIMVVVISWYCPISKVDCSQISSANCKSADSTVHTLLMVERDIPSCPHC